jgi:hypothetical protein
VLPLNVPSLLQSAQKPSPSRQSARTLVQPARRLAVSLVVPVWPVFALGRAACSDRGGASSLHLCMFGASRSGDPGSPKPFHGNGGSSVSSLRHAMFSALGFNASGSAPAAFSATPMSLTLAVPSVGAGAAYVPCSCKDHITAPLAAARATWQHASQLDTPRRCPSQPHTPRCRTPRSCTHRVAARLAAAQATSPSPSQLPGHVAASLAAPNKYQVFIKTWYSTCTRLDMTGILTTQHKMPGTKGTCHPNPEKPLPGMPGRGILGLG